MACAVVHNIAIQGHPQEPVGEPYNEGAGEAHNVAGGSKKRQALIEEWY